MKVGIGDCVLVCVCVRMVLPDCDKRQTDSPPALL